jgi:hypothetical protein
MLPLRATRVIGKTMTAGPKHMTVAAGSARGMRAVRRGWSVLLAGLALVLAGLGCQSDALGIGTTVPVKGAVLVRGRPLHLKGAFGRVWFYPDADKGNHCSQVAVGDIDANGHYQLHTRDRDGAPVGWYKVMVVAVEQIDPHRPKQPRRCLIHPRYSAIETSGLRVEVVAEPADGAYDLNLSP